MPHKKSAGILMYRKKGNGLEVLLVHPGGPFWAKKDLHAWSIPKGEFVDESPLEAAKRELTEETGVTCAGELIPLGELKQPSGKILYAWALEQDWDPTTLRSNLFELEWPPKSGRMKAFPEIDRAMWFAVPSATEKIHQGQVGFLEQLVKATQ
ncbi:MAG TPA: NUDIX domain-containing protein [Polyangiaceae bacterium]